MNIFLNAIESGKINSFSDLKAVFETLLIKIEREPFSFQKTTIQDLLNQYDIAESKMQNNETNETRYFNFYVFSQLISKIKSLGISKSNLLSSEFKINRNYLVKEINRDDFSASRAFNWALSEDFVLRTKNENIELFYIGISNITTNFVNSHQYKKQNVINTCKIGESYLQNIIDKSSSSEEINNINTIKNWLAKIIQEYIMVKFI